MINLILLPFLTGVSPLATMMPSHSIEQVSQERPTLLLFYTGYCPYCQKVLKYLKKIHRQIPVKNLQEHPEAKEELRRVGGKMQVPCLIINGKALYESDAIINWLSDHKNYLEKS